MSKVSYEKIILDNGVRVVHQRLEGIRSASLGIWVGAGSRHEPKKYSGYAHFIEHMVFKGTDSRSAAEIAGLMDGIGGQVNAFTTKECTCFYARALDSHIPIALDVLCDIFFESKFSQEDVDNELGVILEEIGMYEDSPDDLVSERLLRGVYPGSLGRPVLGSASVLKKASGAALKDYMHKTYLPQNTVVAIAGSYSGRDIDEICRRFSEMKSGKLRKQEQAGYQPCLTVKKKSIEQNHFCLAFPGLSYSDDDRYALQIMSNILGGGMSSRLFQRVREERGLCYTIYSFLSSHADTGILGIYTALGGPTEDEALGLISEVIRDFVKNGVSDEELRRTREQVKANVLMGLESTVSRMNNLARGELFLGGVISPEEIIAACDAVNTEDICRLGGELLDFEQISLSAVGKVKDGQAYQSLLSQ